MKKLHLATNKTMTTTKLLSILSSLALCTVTYGAVTITFPDGGGLDQAGIGGSKAVTDGSFNFNLTTVDILANANETVGGAPNFTLASGGATHRTSTHDSLNFGIRGSGDNGQTAIDAGEAWFASFDQDIIFDSFLLSSFSGGDALSLTILDGSNSGAGQVFAATSGSVTIGSAVAAGTVLRFEATAGDSRIESLTVTAVPEPSSSALLVGAIALGAFKRRRK
jgi:hypothetical protein